MKKMVVQLNCYMKTPEEVKDAVAALLMLEDCIDAGAFGLAVHAHFEVDQDISPDVLPDGCRLVDASIVPFIQSRR